MSADLLISIILFFTIICQYVAWRTKMPAILYLIIFGIISGPVLGIIPNNSEYFQNFFDIFLPLAAALILFEGGLSLNFREIRETKNSIIKLLIISAPISFILSYLLFYKIGGISYELSMIMGAVLIISGPTVILPIIKNAKLNSKTSSILKWEGIILDPVGALLAIFLLEYILEFRQSNNIYQDIGLFSAKLLLISLLSYFLARLVKYVFSNGLIPESLKLPAVLSVSIMIYFLNNHILEEGGLIAITIFGITMANIEIPKVEELKKFKENIVTLALSMVFILIVGSLDYKELLSISFNEILIILAFLIFIRPISVLASLSFSKSHSLKEKIFLGLISPKGIICVVLVSFISKKLSEAGVPGTDKMESLVMWIVLISIISSSLVAVFFAKYFNVKASKKNIIVTVGINSFTESLSKVLKESGFEVIFTSTNWKDLKNAKMSGLNTYHGEILSEDAYFELNFSECDHLIVATENAAYNSLIYTNFLYEFGRNNIFQFKVDGEKHHEKHQYNYHLKANLVSEDYSIINLSKKIDEGWEIKRINVSPEYNLSELNKKYDGNLIILFEVNKEENKLTYYDPEKKYVDNTFFAMVYDSDNSQKVD